MNILFPLVFAVVPAYFVFSPGLSRLIRSTVIRFLCAIGIVWFFLNVWQSMAVQIAVADAQARGDMMYDGVGGNAAIFLFGWLPPLVCGFPFFLTKVIMNCRKKSAEARERNGSCRSLAADIEDK